MMARQLLALGAALVMVASATPLLAGGWVVVTLKNAHTHLTLGDGGFIYTVRQHGHTPLNELEGQVEARKGDLVVIARAIPLVSTAGVRSPGAYQVGWRFPEPGIWEVELTAGSGLVGDKLTLTYTVLPAGYAAPVVAAAVRGRQMFEGKGCVTCHSHEAFPGRKGANLLDMTGTRYTPDAVRAFLQSVPDRPVGNDSFGTMPDLGLSASEIDALAAFLSQ